MDDFFRNENIEIFKKWIYFQILNNQKLLLESYDDCHYKMCYKDKVAYLVIWPQGIIEETMSQGDKILFYLHYQFYNFYFAKDLFYRMIDKLTEEIVILDRNILLCCTSGMTTSFFADKMNKYCQLNQKLYHFQATSIYNLDELYQNYQFILIAPQLKYKIAELSSKYTSASIQSIDSLVFATYDCQSLLKQIEDFYEGEV